MKNRHRAINRKVTCLKIANGLIAVIVFLIGLLFAFSFIGSYREQLQKCVEKKIKEETKYIRCMEMLKECENMPELYLPR